MNVLFFLIPKNDVAFIYDDFTLRQTIEKFDIYGYTTIPIISRDGKYVNSISEGDILHFLKKNPGLDLFEAEDVLVSNVAIKRNVNSINVSYPMESLFELAINQNFVPVVDDLNNFIGIVTRKAIIDYFYKEEKNKMAK